VKKERQQVGQRKLILGYNQSLNLYYKWQSVHLIIYIN
jgi:hypothetical protein